VEVSQNANELESAATLVSRILSGEATAEAELVDRYKRGISVILMRAAGQRSIAEDLLQDTFRLTLEKIRRGDLREPERLSGFICNIARNLATAHFRRASRQETLEAQIPLSADADYDPLQCLLAAEKAAIVRRILGELPSLRDRDVLYRFYLADQDKEQICLQLGLSSLHFNRVLFRARERYKELYERFLREQQNGMR
jgi:RNA polymerase sigma-70 factor (ECF subfamily)